MCPAIISLPRMQKRGCLCGVSHMVELNGLRSWSDLTNITCMKDYR